MSATPFACAVHFVGLRSSCRSSLEAASTESGCKLLQGSLLAPGSFEAIRGHIRRRNLGAACIRELEFGTFVVGVAHGKTWRFFPLEPQPRENKWPLLGACKLVKSSQVIPPLLAL